jgi:ubiquitin-protein ligase
VTFSIIDLSQNDERGCSVGLEDENNFFKWNVVFEGPTETLYEV